MKIKILLTLLLAMVLPASVFAINAPLVDEPPSTINANYYTFTIRTELGAKITVVGGPSDTAPVTDGVGSDEEDGVVEVVVGLAQESTNIFSITAEKNSVVSSSVSITITETAGDSSGEGDITPPSAPILNAIPDMVDTAEYIIRGMTEPNANIYARLSDMTIVGSTQADSSGYFQVTVPLEQNKTNRINVSAEDEMGNEGYATQALIRQSVNLPEEVIEPEPELYTSSQMFFSDTNGHWAESYIGTLYDAEVVSGKTATTFEPNSNITRAELTKIALLAFGHSVNTSVKEHPFSDVPMNSWFAPYVEEAKTQGIIEGYPSGGFGPNDFITRAAALKIIIESAGFAVIGGIPIFSDVPTDSWFTPYVTFANNNEVVGGYPDGTFGPGRNITRAEVAKIVVKVMKMKEL